MYRKYKASVEISSGGSVYTKDSGSGFGFFKIIFNKNRGYIYYKPYKSMKNEKIFFGVVGLLERRARYFQGPGGSKNLL
jgi:hypothetical protein